MPKCPRVVAFVAVAVQAFLAVGVGAQRTPGDPSAFRYHGRVVDTSGSPLPGVEATCTLRGGVTHRANSDDKGEDVA